MLITLSTTLVPCLKLEGVELDVEISEGFSVMVEIPDPNLRQLIRDTLSLPEAMPLTQGQMLRLTILNAGGDRGITNLTGLEYATNIRSLLLYRNPIVDISPLTHLIKLDSFNLWECRIVDLSPLRNLKNLRHIRLGYNQISDLSPLVELINLTVLQVNNNQIVDFSPAWKSCQPSGTLDKPQFGHRYQSTTGTQPHRFSL